MVFVYVLWDLPVEPVLLEGNNLYLLFQAAVADCFLCLDDCEPHTIVISKSPSHYGAKVADGSGVKEAVGVSVAVGVIVAVAVGSIVGVIVGVTVGTASLI